MGMSPSIKQLEAKETEFRAYLSQLQTELATKSAAEAAKLKDKIAEFYDGNKYTDAKDLVSGMNYDFMHEAEFSLENMQGIIDAISKSVFAGGKSPDGAKVSKDGAAAAATSLGPEVGEMANLELYIAGQVFDVLSSVILSFGTSTTINFNTNLQSKPLGYGMQMFTAVAADSYQAQAFFDKEYIHEYLYLYDVRFSAQQAKAEMTQTLIELYEDQLAAFKAREEDLLDQLVKKTLTDAAYATANAIYDKLIEAVKKKVDQLKVAALAAKS
ncbi:hypothetical protein SAMN05892883_3391 [Jatrophihabitans sp. GAS493]|uniref:hypothetical protein n=1 Tax=Jatrophihabitans sp. GAS493 TaxID=1907575 RepID=UPI000BBF85FC|nr:hypothetical protein [Jatrophihabitans sp. GAS493]SOD74210.1 hypothetical protein SAMN05892883_3391 [Jatrophihabitans sp. GAS493]